MAALIFASTLLPLVTRIHAIFNQKNGGTWLGHTQGALESSPSSGDLFTMCNICIPP